MLTGNLRQFGMQIFLALIGLIYLSYYIDYAEFKNLYFPFFKNLLINLGWFFIPFSIFVIVGSSNAVNLTDGLDGLATVPVILVAGCFAFISYVTGNIFFSEYLQILYIQGTGEISIFCGSIIGACFDGIGGICEDNIDVESCLNKDKNSYDLNCSESSYFVFFNTYVCEFENHIGHSAIFNLHCRPPPIAAT